MVCVTLGTQKQPFKRIIDYVLKSKELEDYEIVIQAGNTHYELDRDKKNIKIFDFIDNDSFVKYIDKAAFVICHGGVGSIFNALEKNKKVIAIPRLKKYFEHVDDHQLEVCKKLASLGYIEVLDDGDVQNIDYSRFDDLIKKAKDKEFVKYVPNDNYLKILEKEI